MTRYTEDQLADLIGKRDYDRSRSDTADQSQRVDENRAVLCRLLAHLADRGLLSDQEVEGIVEGY